MSADESVPMGQLTPDALEQARAATAPEVDAVAKRHAAAAAQHREFGARGQLDPAHGDRGWLLEQVRLRDAQIRMLGKELERLRAREAEWAEAERAAVDEAARLRPIVEAVAEVNIEGGFLPLGLRHAARAALGHADPPPELASTGTFQIAGRGTIKVIHPDKLPKGYVLKVGDPVRIDGQDWRCVGIESHRHKDGSIGVLVRPAGTLASLPVDGDCDGSD